MATQPRPSTGFWRKKRVKIGLPMMSSLLITWFFSLPAVLFDEPTATVITDRDNNLLSATIATDGQWRFPEVQKVPEKFQRAILHFEDEYFPYHPGVNPVSMVRAMLQNIRSGRIVSGGSTITMQVIRLSRKGKARTFKEKLVEIWLATRLELTSSKEEILRLYASHAPFGGNIVGLEAAAWRYFSRTPQQLSWGEAALLAVLPNRPGLIFPGRNQQTLLAKRDRLLHKLHQKGQIDSLTMELAKSEPLPGAPLPLPSLAPHLLTRNIQEGRQGKRIRTTIDATLQADVEQIIARYHSYLKGNEIYNAAAMVMDVETGEVLAYAGNTRIPKSEDYGDDVDVISAPRSSGSILKPFLFSMMMNEGMLLPEMLVPDIPTYVDGFAPQNFSKTYDGAVAAKTALARSLNVPAVRLLSEYGVEKFHQNLQKMGMTTLHQPPLHYGLSLILGGAECSLWDVCGMYGSMARVLNHFPHHSPHPYKTSDWKPPHFLPHQTQPKTDATTQTSIMSAAAIWYTFDAMLDVYRPDRDASWQLFETPRKVAWKTGTSFGNRDAWAVGTVPRYVVGVWVGNADGEGRPGLTGLSAAAPILFEIFDRLPQTDWFEAPLDELIPAPICRISGHLASDICPTVDTLDIPRVGERTKVCPYHEWVHLDASGQFRVHSDCEAVSKMQHTPFFVLPPVQEWYFRKGHTHYRRLPPFRADCMESSPSNALSSMQIIYPLPNGRIYVPRELDGSMGKSVFEVAHRKPSSTIFWHLDGVFLGQTKRIHEMGLQPAPGQHELVLVDENGESIRRSFTVIGEEKPTNRVR